MIIELRTTDGLMTMLNTDHIVSMHPDRADDQQRTKVWTVLGSSVTYPVPYDALKAMLHNTIGVKRIGQ